MFAVEPGLRLRVLFTEGTRRDHQNLDEVLLQQARDVGVDRAILSRAVDGFSSRERRRGDRQGLLVLEAVGDERAILGLQARVQEFVVDALVMTQRVQIARRSRPSAPA